MQRLHITKCLALAVSALMLALIACIPASAQGAGGRILLYESDITIWNNTTMSVVDTVKVEITEKSKNRGIYLDYPTFYTDNHGRQRELMIHVVDVYGVPPLVERHSGYIRVYLSNKDVSLEPGIYTYAVRYSVNRQLRFYQDHSEFCWNVAGRSAFPIDKAIARIDTLGAVSAKDIKLYRYTGHESIRKQDFKTGISERNYSYIETTRPLSPGENFTIAATWYRGSLMKPTKKENTDKRVLLYESDIVVNEDSSMTVAETITVKGIHGLADGLCLSFPTTTDKKEKVRFNVEKVLRNGLPAPCQVERYRNYIDIHIKGKKAAPQPKTCTYTIKYSTNNRISFFQSYDRLLWNVNGDWDIPTSKVAARITLPGRIPQKAIKLGGYTVWDGDKAKEFKSGIDKNGRIYFKTTRPLYRREGFVIVADWPKGFVKKPTIWQELVTDKLDITSGIAGLLAVLLYFIIVWSAVGRDPAKGTIIPLYAPPDEISPAAMGYIYNMGWDRRVTISALTSMAAKGYVTLEEKDGTYTVRRSNAPDSVLASEEAVLAETLLGGKDYIELNSANKEKLQEAEVRVYNLLQKEYQKRYFSKNSYHLAAGVLLSITALLLCGLSVPRECSFWDGVFILSLTLLIFLALAVLMPIFARKLRRSLYDGPGHRIRRINAGCLIFAIAAMITFYTAGSVAFITDIPATFTAMIFAMAFIDLLFYYLLMAPTKEGRKVLDAIEGFKMYLSVAERDTLSEATPMEKSAETFEKYLPYAFALGVEQIWSELFTDLIEDTVLADHPNNPLWYRKNGRNMPSALENIMSDTLSASLPQLGSKSGDTGVGDNRDKTV